MTERKLKHNRVMTYNEVAVELWESEGRKGKPISKEGIRKIELRALNKVKLHLANAGFSEQDVIEHLATLNEVNEYEVMR